MRSLADPINVEHTGGPWGTFAQVEAGRIATILDDRWLNAACREAIRSDEIIMHATRENFELSWWSDKYDSQDRFSKLLTSPELR